MLYSVSRERKRLGRCTSKIVKWRAPICFAGRAQARDSQTLQRSILNDVPAATTPIQLPAASRQRSKPHHLAQRSLAASFVLGSLPTKPVYRSALESFRAVRACVRACVRDAAG